MGFAASTAGGVLVWANLGGVIGCILLGILSHRFTVRKLCIGVLSGSMLTLIAFGQVRADLSQLSFFAGIAGFFTNGTIICLYTLFAHSYPTDARAGGTGFVIGIGRGGAALGPIAAGLLFSAGYDLASVAIFMSFGCLIAAAAIFLLRNAEQ